MKAPVSVLIPVKNERANIAPCLASVAWAGEVFVVDSSSTDGTQQIASHLGARVVQFEYTPGGPKKKNWALRNIEFSHDWILILDADERIPAALADEIAKIVEDGSHEYSGFYINRRFFFLGRWIRHAGYFPSWNLRLLRRGCGEYESVPDFMLTTGDNEVHEHVIMRGKAGWLTVPMDHYAYPSIEAFVEKHNRYSTWESRVGILGVQMQGQLPWFLAMRRVARRIGRKLPLPDVARFFYHYVLQRGFMDGLAGYILCRLLGHYEFQIWSKKFEARKP